MTRRLDSSPKHSTRARWLFAAVAASTALVLGCSASNGSDPEGNAGTGPSEGGAASGQGGRSTSAGGAPAAGSPATGTGGASNVAGAGSGGAAPGSGGTPTSGGAPASGGASASGGAKASGGSAGTPGAAGSKASGGTPGTGGGSGTGGATGSGGGSATGHPPCNYSSGLNVAWVNFARDVPNPNMNTFNTIFKNTFNAGGRVIRWWFHTNGTTTPGYDSSGMAQKLQQSHIDGVKSILSAANAAGVSINISLWSFDMLQSNAGTTYTNNQALLEKDANRQAYIDNYLTPLVTALKGTPGLYSYEIFNEPEGMGPKGWATHKTTQAAIQKTVNWLAAAIHTADPTALVTNGSQTFDYCSAVSGKSNWYSDSALRAAGGKQNGTLDYYEVHYYASNGASDSPFTHSATSWGLDKKLVIGEFAAQATDGVALNNLYTSLYTGGYNGSWAWSYSADYPWPAMQAPMQALFTAHSDVGTCP